MSGRVFAALFVASSDAMMCAWRISDVLRFRVVERALDHSRASFLIFDGDGSHETRVGVMDAHRER
jgi:hypothetical protein